MSNHQLDVKHLSMVFNSTCPHNKSVIHSDYLMRMNM